MSVRNNEVVQFVLSCVGRWLDIRLEWGTTSGNNHPTDPDVDHSALLDRLLSGEKPFRYPPPTVYSYPHYSLAEGRPIHFTSAYFYDKPLGTTFDPGDVGTGNIVRLAQSSWWIAKSLGEKEFMIKPNQDHPVSYHLAYREGGWVVNRQHPDPEYLWAPDQPEVLDCANQRDEDRVSGNGPEKE